MSSKKVTDSSMLVPYEKPVSTWKVLSDELNVAERDYMKFFLGQSLIEKYEEIEAEIESLLDIWREYRNETVAHCTDPSAPKLAEPPVLRQRLTNEIEFFVKHIHEQCANNDRIFNRRLSSGHNWNAINYALVAGTGEDERRIRERPVSARDRHGRETPILTIPPPASNLDEEPMARLLSPRSTPKVDVEQVREKLQTFTLDEIIQNLKDAINQDICTLEEHVTYLHQKLEEEAEYRAKTRGLLREPTLGELKEERNRLEKEIFQTSNNVDLPSTPATPLQRQTSDHDRSRRSSSSSTTSSLVSPRSSLDGVMTPIRLNGPLRASAVDTVGTSKPRLAIDRKSILPSNPISSANTNAKTTTSNTPVVLRLGTIKQQDLLKKYPSATKSNTKTTTENSATRLNSADKFRRMVLDCREMSS